MFTNRMRFTGMSGIDTHSMVEQIMRAESMRHTRLLRQATLTTFRIDAFRSVSTKLHTFNRSSLDVLSSNSIRMASNFRFSTGGAAIGTNGIAPPGVNVNTSGATQSGTHTLRVIELAQRDRFRTDTSVAPLQDHGRLIGTSFAGTDTINFDNLSNLVTFNTNNTGVASVNLNNLSFNVNLDGVTRAITVDRDMLLGFFETDETLSTVPPTPPTPGSPTYSWALIRDGSDYLMNGGNHVWMRFDIDSSGATPVRTASLNSAASGTFALDLANEINDRLVDAFGFHSGVSPFVAVDLISGGPGVDWIRFNTHEGNTVRIIGSDQVMSVLGTTSNQSTRFDTNRTLGDLSNSLNTTPPNWVGGEISFEINGQTITARDDMRLSDFMALINRTATGVNMSFDHATGEFMLQSSSPGAANAINFGTDRTNAVSFFGMFEIDVSAAAAAARDPEDIAQNAIVRVNGVLSTRPNNNIEIAPGVFVNLDQDTFNPANLTPLDNTADNDITITVTNNIEPVFDLIMNFVNEYNRMMEALNELVRTARPRSVSGDLFEPLTDEERRGLSEAEIRDWEERARTGMLHRDPTVQRIMRDMRNALMSPFEFTDSDGVTRRFTLASIGLSTSGNIGDGGLLRVDEARLREALENDPEMVTALFTNTGTGVNQGLGDRLDAVFRNATVGANSLIARQAGLAGDVVSEQTSSLHRLLERQNGRIERMLASLQRREEQLFIMFSRMEIAVMQADAQMAQLMGLFGQMGM